MMEGTFTLSKTTDIYYKNVLVVYNPSIEMLYS